MKIAVIGAGSLTFTHTFVRDILSVPALRGVTVSLTDIDERNLDRIARLIARDIASGGLPARMEASPDRRKAFADADIVINATRIGGLQAFHSDIEIPLRYGVDQCVGDTLCAGGIFYGQRGIPALLEFCRDIRETARPGVRLFNYGNPNAMLTWAANAYGGVDCIGLCHGVEGGHHQIANVIEREVNGRRKPGSRGYRAIDPDEVDIVCAGINHQTWYIVVQFEGEDWTGRLLEGFLAHPEYARTEKVRIDMLRRFGYYSTESNGHLSEYVAWYRKRPGETRRWVDLGKWIDGETGGYLRVCTEKRHAFDRGFRQWIKAEPWNPDAHRRSGEHASYMIEGLVTGRVYRGHFNVINRGCIANLPDDCVIEAPGYVDRTGIRMPRVGELPPGCAAVCSQSVHVQRLAVLAAVRGDVALLKQAMMLDPLVGAVCTTPEISHMTDTMLVAQARWLPQYAAEIPPARRRLRTEPAPRLRPCKGVRR